jgi:hypothetical protein
MAGYIKEWTTLDASEIHTYYSVNAVAIWIGCFAWCLDLLLHTLFIMKYWLTSRRVESILLSQDPSNSVRIARITTIALCALSVLACVTAPFILMKVSKNNEKGQLQLPILLLALSIDSTPIVLFFFLLSAFHKLRQLEGKSSLGLARKEVILMLVANGAYACLDPVVWVSLAMEAYGPVALFLTVLGYAANLLGLLQVTHMLC